MQQTRGMTRSDAGRSGDGDARADPVEPTGQRTPAVAPRSIVGGWCVRFRRSHRSFRDLTIRSARSAIEPIMSPVSSSSNALVVRWKW